MTADDNPYAAIEAIEVKARTARKHEAHQRIDAARSLIVTQDGAVRDPHYRGGAVFEFWYHLAGPGVYRNLTRVEAQDLLDGYEPEAPLPPTPTERLAAPKSLEAMLARPTKYTQPAPVTIQGERGATEQSRARYEALSTLPDPQWWDARARYVGDAWQVTFERRVRRRE